jgi:hypothetical protein
MTVYGNFGRRVSNESVVFSLQDRERDHRELSWLSAKQFDGSITEQLADQRSRFFAFDKNEGTGVQTGHADDFLPVLIDDRADLIVAEARIFLALDLLWEQGPADGPCDFTSFIDLDDEILPARQFSGVIHAASCSIPLTTHFIRGPVSVGATTEDGDQEHRS